MSTHRALAERFAETLTDHDLDGFAELLAEEYVNHNRYAAPGKDGSVAVFADFIGAFEASAPRSTTSSTLATRWSAGTPTADATRARSWACRRAAQRSSCTRSTSGGSATAACTSTGTS